MTEIQRVRIVLFDLEYLLQIFIAVFVDLDYFKDVLASILADQVVTYESILHLVWIKQDFLLFGRVCLEYHIRDVRQMRLSLFNILVFQDAKRHLLRLFGHTKQ